MYYHASIVSYYNEEGNIIKKSITLGILLLLAVAYVAPAGASLVGTAFGYPTIEQLGSTTAFNRDTSAATDNEAFALSFPTDGGSVAFPSITQTVDQTQILTHEDYTYTTEYAAFSYPFASVGGVSIPSFGFGF
jgi:hypothetical protein